MIFKSFFNAFPAPHILTMPSVGISISQSRIRFILFEDTREGLRIAEHGERKLSPGVVSSGYINEPQKIIEILSELRQRYGFQFVTLTLPEEKAYLFKTEIPEVKGGSVRDSVEFRIEENVPLSVSQSVFDCDVVDATKNKDLDVAVSVVPLQTVEAYLDVVHAAGMTPLSCEVESQAVTRAVIASGDKRAYIIVNVEAPKIHFYIVSDEVVHFTSTIDIEEEGGSVTDFSQEDFQKDDQKNSLKENEKGVQNTLSNTSSLNDDVITSLNQQVKKLLNYWSNEHQLYTTPKQITAIILTGEDVSKNNVFTAISSYFDTPVELANVWINTFSLDEHIPDIFFEESLTYASSVGLALPPKKEKDSHPEKKDTQKDKEEIAKSSSGNKDRVESGNEKITSTG